MHLAFRDAHFELKGGRGQNIVSYLNGTLTSLRLAVGEPPATTSLGGAWRSYANLGGKVPRGTAHLEQSSLDASRS
jgi:hypothetical protein